jgi:hypothetical protein
MRVLTRLHEVENGIDYGNLYELEKGLQAKNSMSKVAVPDAPLGLSGLAEQYEQCIEFFSHSVLPTRLNS